MVFGTMRVVALATSPLASPLASQLASPLASPLYSTSVAAPPSAVAKRFQLAEAMCAPALRDARCAEALSELRREVESQRFLAASRAGGIDCWLAERRRGGSSTEADRFLDGCESADF